MMVLIFIICGGGMLSVLMYSIGWDRGFAAHQRAIDAAMAGPERREPK